MTESTRVGDFWSWFSSIAASLAVNIESPALLEELDTWVRDLDSMLSWEVGPGSSEPWQLVISPNLNRELAAKNAGNRFTSSCA